MCKNREIDKHANIRVYMYIYIYIYMGVRLLRFPLFAVPLIFFVGLHKCIYFKP